MHKVRPPRLTAETLRILRHGERLKIGRSNDYKKGHLHIPDLKVPKKYVTLSVAASTLFGPQTLFSIGYESICTSKVNGRAVKLESRDAKPIVESYTEDVTIYVNANKTDRIVLRVEWVDVNLRVFSKQIQYEGVNEDSPLPGLVDEMHSLGWDFRLTAIERATHYVTVGEHVNLDFQIAVARAIPIVTRKWLDYLLHNADPKQLTDVSKALLLETPGNYAWPDARRRTLLKGVTFEDNKIAPLVKAAGGSIGAGISVAVDKLWEGIKNVDAEVAKAVAAFKRGADSPRPREEPPTRRKRRKIERVDADFFFSQDKPVVQVKLSFDDKGDPSSEVKPESGVERTQESGVVVSSEPCNPPGTATALPEPKISEVADSIEKDFAQPKSTPEAMPEPTEPETSPEMSAVKRKTGDAEPRAKRPKTWVTPKVTLSEAVMDAKKQKEEELDMPSDFSNLVIVEEFELVPRPKARSSTPTGKNFKTFRKVWPRTATSYIALSDAALHDPPPCEFPKNALPHSQPLFVDLQPNGLLSAESDDEVSFAFSRAL